MAPFHFLNTENTIGVTEQFCTLGGGSTWVGTYLTHGDMKSFSWLAFGLKD